MHLDRSEQAQQYAKQVIDECKTTLDLIKHGKLILKFEGGVLTKVTEQELKTEIFEIEWAMLTGLIWPTVIPPTRLLENHSK